MTSRTHSKTTPAAAPRAYESPALIDLGLIHDRTATYCDIDPGGPGGPGSDSGVVADPDFDDRFPKKPC